MSADFWTTIVILGGIVYGSRAVGLVAIPGGSIPPALERRLRLVPVAILTALIAPNLVTPSSMRDPAILLASAVTALVAGLARRPALALLAGLLTVTLVRALV